MNVTRRNFLCFLAVATAGLPIAARARHQHQSHFMLYAKLDRQRRIDGLTAVRLPASRELPAVASTHPYFEAVSAGPQILTNSCSATCC